MEAKRTPALFCINVGGYGYGPATDDEVRGNGYVPLAAVEPLRALLREARSSEMASWPAGRRVRWADDVDRALRATEPASED